MKLVGLLLESILGTTLQKRRYYLTNFSIKLTLLPNLVYTRARALLIVVIYLFSGTTSLLEYPLEIQVSYSSGIEVTPYIFLLGSIGSSSSSLSKSIPLLRSLSSLSSLLISYSGTGGSSIRFILILVNFRLTIVLVSSSNYLSLTSFIGTSILSGFLVPNIII